MNDSFLRDLRREPSPEFAQRLRLALREVEAESAPPPWGRAGRWAALAASLALIVSAFTLPAVRAGAQAFLDLFRVVNFVGVSFDPGRLRQLKSEGLDLPGLLGQQVRVLENAGPPVQYSDPDAAASAAGMDLETPAWLPAGLARTGIAVAGEKAFRVTADTTRLQAVLDALAIDDVVVPPDLDGQSAEIRVPPIVQMLYASASGYGRVQLLQARTPNVQFPAGIDLTTLARIGLRILGMDPGEASRFARSIDWRSTLIVPVPTAASSFRRVDVAGSHGLLVEFGKTQAKNRTTAMILWSAGGRVYALRGNLRETALLQMADTMR